MTGWRSADVTRLREAMTEQDRTVDEIATEIRLLTRCSPLAAYRMAHGWSQPQAVEHYNRTIGAGYVDQPSLSRLERFPTPGQERAPQATQFIGWATLYRTTPLRLLTPDALAKLNPQDQAVLLRLNDSTRVGIPTKPAAKDSLVCRCGARLARDNSSALCSPCMRADGERTLSVEPEAPPLHIGKSKGHLVAPQTLTAHETTPTIDVWSGRGQLVEPQSAILERIRQQSVHHVTDALLDALDLYVSDVVDRYEEEGPATLAPDVVRQRQWAQRLLVNCLPSKRGERLVRIAGRLSAQLAYMAVNLGRFNSARAYGIEAFELADQVSDDELKAWVRGTQSFTEYYTGHYANIHLVCVGSAGGGIT